MSMPEYWESARVAEYLKIKPNNLYQIVFRMKRDHLAMGHKSDKCDHLLIDHIGMGKRWYRADKVKRYDLYRKGQIDHVNEVVRNRRDEIKRYG